MHPADIQAALKKRHVRQVDIATQQGVTQATVSDVIKGRTRSARLQRAISRACGLPLSQLWPTARPPRAHHRKSA